MLTIYQLEVTIEATTLLALDTYCGSALRGAFFRALWGRFCSNREATTCYECPLNEACPVSTLVAPLRDEAPRGRDIPRPYIITPSLTGKELYAPGERYTFGFTLIGTTSKLYPYVIRAFLEMERHTLGHPLKELQGKRGSFRLLKIEAIHPFTHQRICLWQQGEKSPGKLQGGVTAEDVRARAILLPQDALGIHFLSPTRLVAEGQVLRRPDLSVLVLRMAERLEQMRHEYGNGGDQEEHTGREWYLSIKKQAEGIHLEQDATRWVEVYSYSNRQHQKISVSGIVGKARFVGPMTGLQELLIWGELLRVGKHIVKGAGLYHIEI